MLRYVLAERSAQLIGMLTGEAVSSGWVHKAVARMSGWLRAWSGEAMAAALAAEDVLAADETPVNVLDKTPLPAPAADDAGEADPEEKEAGRRPPPGRRTCWSSPRRTRGCGSCSPWPPQGRCRRRDPRRVRRAPHDRRLCRVTSTSWDWIAGIQQCCQHVIRRCRAVEGLGPGSLQSWAGDIIAILAQAHRAVEDARARGDTSLDPKLLAELRERYDTAVRSGIIHNRLRTWASGNHPGYALGCWLRDYEEQVFLFTREFAVDWTNNVSDAEPRPPNATRPYPGTGIPWQPSRDGAGSAATSTPPPPTARPPAPTPSATPSPENPGLPPLPGTA